MALKVVIVGGVAGGATAAARIRRLDEKAQIILFEKGEYISFANCGLPYHIGGIIKERDQLLVQTPERMKKRFNIDVRINSEVLRIDRKNKLVEVYCKTDGKTYTESYDKLVLSPGAESMIPALAGIESPGIFKLRNIPDAYEIKDFVDKVKPKRAIIVGAGFIGLELAENLEIRGVKVTIVELADHVIGHLDYDMAAIVHQHMKSKNIELYLKDAVKSFANTDNYIIAELSSGKSLKADMAVLGIGVRPLSKLAIEAGLKIGETGGILVDEYMRTSDPDIYAVGDAAEIKDFVSGNKVLVPLAGPANKQGRIAANNICGREEKYEGAQGTSIVRVFDVTVATTGNNERTLKKNGVDYEKSFTHSPSHAGYYPGSLPMCIKLLFSKKDGKILGAQIVGYEGVDKRIDVIATAIRANMTVHDLEKLELAYAPPYSSAKDPVNIAGYVASNVLKGDCDIFHWHDVAEIDLKNAMLLDVRTEEEYNLGTIEGAVNIPLDELRGRFEELPCNKDIYVFCQAGLRGYIACRILMQHGFKNVKNLSGGYKTYQLAIQKQSNEDIYEYDKIMKDDEIKLVDCPCDDSCPKADIEIDACGLQCPGPIIKVYNAIKSMNHGETLRVKATDPAFRQDIKSWCERTGNRLVSINCKDNAFIAVIRKDGQLKAINAVERKNDKTIVVFSNDLDRAIASFIIANGAAALGRKVTMFFTFWGLNILRKPGKVKVRKGLIPKMFGLMMPKGSRRLSLSKVNMAGIGPKMIRFLMKKKNVLPLEELIEQAKANGVNLVACSMSMDIMGIAKEELIDGVEIGGVAAFLGAAEESDMSLFI